MADSIKVILVDDHKIIRDGIKALLADITGIEFVAEADNGADAVAKVDIYDFDVVVMDINMPEMNGIEATKAIIDKLPNAKVLALSMHNDSAYITKMLQAGATGYILKGSGKEELVQAIENVANGKSYFSGEVSDKMMEQFMKNKSAPQVKDDLLSRRELEILRFISDGLTNAVIAEKLFISERTVDSHRRNILQKLNVKNSAEMVKFAYTNGLI